MTQYRRPARIDDFAADSLRALGVLAAHGQQGRAPADPRHRRVDPAVAALIRPGPALAEVSTISMPGEVNPLALRTYRPTHDPRPLPGIVYLHGGGCVLGGLDSHDAFLRTLAAQTGHLVISVDYRLAPEFPFPAAIDDACAATEYIFDHADRFCLDRSRFTLAGDGAGAALAATVAQLTRTAAMPTHQVLINPQTRWQPATASRMAFASGTYPTAALLNWFTECYLPDPDDRHDPLATPTLSGRLGELPPATVITAELDPLRDEGELYARAMSDAGVDVAHYRMPGAFHLLWLATAINSLAQRRVIAFIARRIAGGIPCQSTPATEAPWRRRLFLT
ncbi:MULTISPECIES: alpha/beta hydrolase [unclassified Nocardia]|uniref:alpha/beta hydrolase n=1 Tax=unclassified Nocardia TaxID=2637762 RepID=UPI0035D536CC